jgi:hypothetical protein
MPGNARRRPNQPASGPAVASLFLGFGGLYAPMSQWDDGPKYRNTNTSMSSRKTCFGSPESGDGEGPWAADMIPSPLGRGLPSRHGSGKSY